MPPPKKSKVTPVEDNDPGTTTADTVTTAAEPEDACVAISLEQVDLLHADPQKPLDKELRMELLKETKDARAFARECAVGVRRAEAALRAEERRAEERSKRWDAAEQREEPPPAYLYLQLERLYKGQVKMLRARLALSEAQRVAAEAQVGLSGLLLSSEQLKVARLEVVRCGDDSESDS